MRKIVFLLPLLAFFSACNYVTGSHSVRGNGNHTAQTRAVSGFNSVRVVGGMDVVLASGSSNSVKVEADENLLPYILTDVEGSTLVVRPKQGYSLNSSQIKVYATVPALEGVAISGSGTVTSGAQLASTNKVDVHVSGSGDVKLELDAPAVSTKIDGSGNIIIGGRTRDLESAISGSGETHCFNLQSENSKVSIAGSGSAEVFASKSLDVHISGSGDVAYKGTPTVNQHIAGSGSVRSAQ